jgi:hypothetical protein
VERALDVIVAGASSPNPAELIESQRISEVLAKLAERYELVVNRHRAAGRCLRAFPLLGQVGDRGDPNGAEHSRLGAAATRAAGRHRAPPLGRSYTVCV